MTIADMIQALVFVDEVRRLSAGGSRDLNASDADLAFERADQTAEAYREAWFRAYPMELPR